MEQRNAVISTLADAGTDGATLCMQANDDIHISACKQNFITPFNSCVRNEEGTHIVGLTRTVRLA
jgi:hypothetical protein